MGAQDEQFVFFDDSALETQVIELLGTASMGMATIQRCYANAFSICRSIPSGSRSPSSTI